MCVSTDYDTWHFLMITAIDCSFEQSRNLSHAIARTSCRLDLTLIIVIQICAFSTYFQKFIYSYTKVYEFISVNLCLDCTS